MRIAGRIIDEKKHANCDCLCGRGVVAFAPWVKADWPSMASFGAGRKAVSNIVFESVIGPDGTLHLDLPIGIENANQPVRVVIQSVRKPMTRAEWGAFVRSMAGSITDPTFERPPQLPLETRESLS